MVSKIWRLTLSIFILLSIFLVPIKNTFAAEGDLGLDPTGDLKTTTELGNANPVDITYSVINFSLTFLGIITVILIIVAGFMWLFAMGEEEKIKKAQGILKGAIIGLVLILASFGIAQFVFNSLSNTITEEPTNDETSSGSSSMDAIDVGEIPNDLTAEE